MQNRELRKISPEIFQFPLNGILNVSRDFTSAHFVNGQDFVHLFQINYLIFPLRSTVCIASTSCSRSFRCCSLGKRIRHAPWCSSRHPSSIFTPLTSFFCVLVHKSLVTFDSTVSRPLFEFTSQFPIFWIFQFSAFILFWREECPLC